jgi:hypothetical protein
MSELVRTIQDWPVIIQGALGSALFALLMYVGEKLFSAVPAIFSKLSHKRRRSHLINQVLRLRAIASKDPIQKAYFPSMLWYRASRDVIKALIWLTLGLLFSEVSVFRVIGFIGCLYHLFFALEVVKAIKADGGEIDRRLAEAKQRLEDFNKAQSN